MVVVSGREGMSAVGVFDEKQTTGLQMAVHIFPTHRHVGTLLSSRGGDQVIAPFLYHFAGGKVVEANWWVTP